MVAHEALEPLAPILASLIGMMQERVRFSSTPCRNDQRIFDEEAVMLAFIDHPTTRRENRSMTTATYSQPSAVQM